jgi:hypothetical protein
MGILGANTAVVDGQRVTLPPLAAFQPQSFGLQTSGVPNVSPTVPPIMGTGLVGGSGGSAGGIGYNSVGGYGTADNNAAATAAAAANPFSLRSSPVLWAVAALLGGLLLLQAVNWHETIDAELGHTKASESAGD